MFLFKRRPWAAFLTLSLIGSLLACASYTDQQQDVIEAYRYGRYKAALKDLEKSEIRDQERNRLLYLLEKASILDRMGDAKQARALYLQADRVVDELYTTSISKTAVSFVYNDTATDYEGEDYEKVAIHTQLALSFLGQNQLAEARVEAAKINNRLTEINQRYGDNKNRYSEDAFARYLSGMIYEARGEIDDAIIDYKTALKAYDGLYHKEFDTDAPETIIASLYKLLVQRRRTADATLIAKEHPSVAKAVEQDLKQNPPYGEVAVIHEVGLIAHKENEEFMFPIGGQLVRFSFPNIIYRRFSMGRTGVEVGKDFENAEVVQNMDAIASKTLEDRRGRMIVKHGARLLVKGQLAEQARQNLGPLAGLAANAYNAISETGDTRSWTTLPSRYSVTRLRLPPGPRKLEIITDGALQRIENVQVQSGKLILLRAAVEHSN